jgi:hypothetical protein
MFMQNLLLLIRWRRRRDRAEGRKRRIRTIPLGIVLSLKARRLID